MDLNQHTYQVLAVRSSPVARFVTCWFPTNFSRGTKTKISTLKNFSRGTKTKISTPQKIFCTPVVVWERVAAEATLPKLFYSSTCEPASCLTQCTPPYMNPSNDFFMYTYIHTHLYIYMNASQKKIYRHLQGFVLKICVLIYVHTHMYMQVYTHTHTHIYMNASHKYFYRQLQSFVLKIRMIIYVHTYIYACIHTHTCIYIH